MLLIFYLKWKQGYAYFKQETSIDAKGNLTDPKYIEALNKVILKL
jgi:hypothetical protein